MWKGSGVSSPMGVQTLNVGMGEAGAAPRESDCAIHQDKTSRLP